MKRRLVNFGALGKMKRHFSLLSLSGGMPGKSELNIYPGRFQSKRHMHAASALNLWNIPSSILPAGNVMARTFTTYYKMSRQIWNWSISMLLRELEYALMNSGLKKGKHLLLIFFVSKKHGLLRSFLPVSAMPRVL